ncbi:MAG TPA: hypothetical protein VF718_12385 [Allosphingosinicella sp.]
MRFSASFLLAALLLASLGAKAALTAPAPEPDARRFAREVAAMLREGGYVTRFERRTFGILVEGRLGRCRVAVGDYTPYGTFAERFDQLAAPIGPLRFVYRGGFHARAPKLVPLLDFYAVRELRRVGLPALRHPIAAVAASPGCGLARLDWRRVAALAD